MNYNFDICGGSSSGIVARLCVNLLCKWTKNLEQRYNTVQCEWLPTPIESGPIREQCVKVWLRRD